MGDALGSRARVTPEDDAWLSADEQAAWRGLLRMYAHVVEALQHDLREHGLTLTDYAVLVALDESATGALRPYEVGGDLGIEKSRLSHQIRRLEERGLVLRKPCDTDGRGWMVHLTATGRRALHRAAPGHAAAVRAALIDRLTSAQVRALVDITDAVLRDP